MCDKKIKSLEGQLKNTKIFLNMVIHDMRNPSNSIEFAIKEVIKMLRFDQKREMMRGTSPAIDKQRKGSIALMGNPRTPKFTHL